MMDFINTFAEIVRLSMFIAIPLIIVALAGLFSERSGVVNIALEGIMVFGAVISSLMIGILFNNTDLSGQWLFIIGMLIAIGAGVVFSLLHAFASVNMKANQVISGTALNIFAPAFGVFLARAIFNVSKISYPTREFFIKKVTIFGLDLSNIPVLGPMFFTKTYITVFVGILILVIAYIILYKTKFGLRLRACGEHPQAADAAGVNVYKMRYAGVLISGGLAGLGGLFYIVPISGNYDPLYGVSGYGFLALAVLISGQWKPGRIMVMALLFGFFAKLSNMTDLIPLLDNMHLSTETLRIIPFVVTLFVLMLTSKNSSAPRASGEPYDKGKR